MLMHFEKYLHGMVLKLSGHVKNTISLFYKEKTGWNSDIWNFFSEKMDFFFNFGLFSLKIRLLSLAMIENVIVTSYVRHFHNFCINERGDPTLYHGTKQSYFGPVNFKFIRGVVTTPLVNHVTKKGLVGRGLKSVAARVFYLLINWPM